MAVINPDEISSIIRSKIENFEIGEIDKIQIKTLLNNIRL